MFGYCRLGSFHRSVPLLEGVRVRRIIALLRDGRQVTGVLLARRAAHGCHGRRAQPDDLERLRGRSIQYRRTLALEFTCDELDFILDHVLESILDADVQLLDDEMHGLLHALGNLHVDPLVNVAEVVLDSRVLALLQEEGVLQAERY